MQTDRLGRAPKPSRFPGAGRGPVGNGFWQFLGGAIETAPNQNKIANSIYLLDPGLRRGNEWWKVQPTKFESSVPENARTPIAAMRPTHAVRLFRTAVRMRYKSNGGFQRYS